MYGSFAVLWPRYGKKIEVKTKSLEGNRPADSITEYAHEKVWILLLKAIIGTYGYAGLKKLMVGGLTFGVFLHQSYIPVSLIRPEAF